LLAVAEMESVLAVLCPFWRDAEVTAHGFRGAFDRDAAAEFSIHIPALFHIALAFAGAGGSAFDDGIDERPADRFVRHRFHRQIEL